MRAVRRTLSPLVLLACLLLSPGGAWACACCSNAGEHHVGSARPSEYELSIMRQIRFGGTAQLFLTEADMEESAKGLAHQAESYSLAGSLAGRVWRLTFRDGDKSGTLDLPLPARVSSFTADIRDGRTSAGGGPLLYKEWRFEGQVAAGTGIFRAGIARPTRYSLVLQGRGNSCQSAEDFTHWRLEVTGRKADYAFYGELSIPR